MLLPKSIAATVDKVAKEAIGRDWNLYAVLMTHWAEIVGPDYAEVTTPVKISFPKGKPDSDKWAQGRRTDGVLHVKLPQGLVLDFTYRTGQIKERMTAYFGYPAIERIVFEPFYGAGQEKNDVPQIYAPDPLAMKEVEKATKSIENNELKERLESLASTLLSKPST